MPIQTAQWESASSPPLSDVLPVSPYPVLKSDASRPIPAAPSTGFHVSSGFTPFAPPVYVAPRQDTESLLDHPPYQRTGHWIVPWFTAAAIFAAFFAAAKLPLDNEAAVLHLFLALIPVKIILFMLRVLKQRHSWFLPVPLIHEMLWMGGIFSIVVASIMETVFETQTRGVWDCQTAKPSVLCDVRLAIVFIVTVGFVEEVSKLFPVFRFWGSKKLRSFPRHCRWYFRYAETPQTLALSGFCCGLGFAAVENVLYIMNSDPSQSIAASFWRAILAVPFHLAGTLYASVRLAEIVFDAHDPASAVTYNLARPSGAHRLESATHHASRRSELSVALCDTRETSENRSGLKEAALFFCPCFRYWRCLWLPSLLHGLYDTGLTLAVQLSRLARNALPEDKVLQHVPFSSSPVAFTENLWSRLHSFLFLKIKVPSFLDSHRPRMAPAHVLAHAIESVLFRPQILLARTEAYSPEDALYWSRVYAGLANACFLMTLLSYGLMLGLSVTAFKKLPVSPMRAALRDLASTAYTREEPGSMYDRAYPIPYVYAPCPPYFISAPYNAFGASPVRGPVSSAVLPRAAEAAASQQAPATPEGARPPAEISTAPF